VLDDGEELREAPGHFGYLVVLHDSTAVTPITPRMRKASQRDGSRPTPKLFLCHRYPFSSSAVAFDEGARSNVTAFQHRHVRCGPASPLLR
jgi:hypothetical protein